jgi:hypothetical protein
VPPGARAGGRSGGPADDSDASAVAYGGLQRAAHGGGVEQAVDAAGEGVAEVLRNVVPPPHHGVRAQRGDQRLVRRPRVGDHGEPAGLGQLDGEPADAARRPGDRQHAAGGEVQQVEGPACRQRVQRQRGRLGVAGPAGRPHHVRGGEDDVLGVGAAGRSRRVDQRHDRVADREAGPAAGADLVHDTGRVEARDVGRWPLEERGGGAGPDQGVGRRDRRRPDPDADLAGARVAVRQFVHPQDIGPAETLQRDGLHVTPPRRPRRRQAAAAGVGPAGDEGPGPGSWS